MRQNQAKSRNRFLTQNWYKSKLSGFMFTKHFLNYLRNTLNKMTQKADRCLTVRILKSETELKTIHLQKN